jgi:hypothetical protein
LCEDDGDVVGSAPNIDHLTGIQVWDGGLVQGQSFVKFFGSHVKPPEKFFNFDVPFRLYERTHLNQRPINDSAPGLLSRVAYKRYNELKYHFCQLQRPLKKINPSQKCKNVLGARLCDFVIWAGDEQRGLAWGILY